MAEKLQNTNESHIPHIGKGTLRDRIISSIIKEHLDRIGCTYTASVFGAESGCDDKMLEREELV